MSPHVLRIVDQNRDAYHASSTVHGLLRHMEAEMVDFDREIADIYDEFKIVSAEVSRLLEGTQVTEVLSRDDDYATLKAMKARIEEQIAKITEKLKSYKPQERRLDPRHPGQAEFLVSIKNRSLDLLDAMDKLRSLLSGVENLLMVRGSAGSVGATRMAKVARSLLRWLAKLSGDIYGMLCRLMTPKEWKIGGKVGVPWFTEGYMEITFGAEGQVPPRI